jgi:hypothetical protein
MVREVFADNEIVSLTDGEAPGQAVKVREVFR